jgi:3-oxoacyl-[acyl-carrier protein] reductase
MDLGLNGKVAVVTGAASEHGIGYASALALAAEGADLAVVDIDFDGVQALAEKIKKMGRRSTAVKVDQGVYEQVKNAVAQINEEFGKIDILVNNAALTSNLGAIRKMLPEKWTNEININLSGPYYWTREVLSIMMQNGWGRIVNISSVGGMVGGKGLPGYAASKGGLVAFTKATAHEGASKGVTANVVSLGLVNTAVYKSGLLDPATVDVLKQKTLFGRMAEPNEAADVVAFIASERASFITGANILVDGGMLINA